MSTLTEKEISAQIKSKLKKGEPLRLELPYSGLLYIDQPVPFLLVYRFPKDSKDFFTYHLGMTESSYILAKDDGTGELSYILQTLITQLSETFGSFLILEVWIASPENKNDFTIHINHRSAEAVAKTLKTELEKPVGYIHLSSEIEYTNKIAPADFEPLLSRDEAKQLGCQLLGLEIKPIYIDNKTEKPYPLFTRELRSVFGKALKKSFFEFVRLHTSYNPTHFQMLGTTEVESLAWEIDRKLAALANQFDFLLLMTPVNVSEAWIDFKRKHFQEAPVFHYRHMPIDPELIKRKIYDLPIEQIADPTIAFLFRDKRKEIDRMLSMMIDREKPDFIQSSIQLFGRIDENTLDIAKGILVATTPGKHFEKENSLDAEKFAAMAEAELHYLKQQYPDLPTNVEIRADMEGVLVSRGILRINKNFTVERERAAALIQHEVGTHVVTYFNGGTQPFKLFQVGVPGYEQLQEGLAVLAEFITGGLTNTRLRTLAARLVAVHEMISGRSFLETFHVLTEKYQFKPDKAFTISMRVYRGGGLTKDAVYLQGLLNLLKYVQEGKDLMPLLIGKIRQDYLPIVEELVYRKVLKKIPIKPRFMQEPYLAKIENIKKGITVFNMIQ